MHTSTTPYQCNNMSDVHFRKYTRRKLCVSHSAMCIFGNHPMGKEPGLLSCTGRQASEVAVRTAVPSLVARVLPSVTMRNLIRAWKLPDYISMGVIVLNNLVHIWVSSYVERIIIQWESRAEYSFLPSMSHMWHVLSQEPWQQQRTLSCATHWWSSCAHTTWTRQLWTQQVSDPQRPRVM